MKNTLVKILSQEKRIARVRMVLPVEIVSVKQPTVIDPEAAPLIVSQSEIVPARTVNLDAPLPGFSTFDDVQPTEADYIFPVFRAISAALIEGYWVDYSKPGVLEKSVPMLQGQTVYKNHDFHDVEGWLGVVNRSWWDAEGKQSGGVPGINIEQKIDWRMNPKIARGLLMKPPAIHSNSVTVRFGYEYSHPDLAENGKWRFYDMLGDEVDGEIVRFIANEIYAYWETSLVFQGADSIAKQLPGEDNDETEEMSAARSHSLPRGAQGQTTKEKNTVKLSLEQKKKLGLETHEGDEVPDDVLTPALERLAAQAKVGSTLIGSARAECLRVAMLAETGGASDTKLPDALTSIINQATPTQLDGLTKMYTEKAASRFPQTCQSCGRATSTRSSVEDRSDLPNQATTRNETAPAPVVNTLH